MGQGLLGILPDQRYTCSENIKIFVKGEDCKGNVMQLTTSLSARKDEKLLKQWIACINDTLC